MTSHPPFPAILELWLPFRGLTTDSPQPQLQDRGEWGGGVPELMARASTAVR